MLDALPRKKDYIVTADGLKIYNSEGKCYFDLSWVESEEPKEVNHGQRLVEAMEEAANQYEKERKERLVALEAREQWMKYRARFQPSADEINTTIAAAIAVNEIATKKALERQRGRHMNFLLFYSTAIIISGWSWGYFSH